MAAFTELVAQRDFNGIRETLAGEYKNNPAFATKFPSLGSALAPTSELLARFFADPAVKEGLEDNIQRRLDPSLFEDHLSEASRRLDLCLLRMKDVQQIEADAVTLLLSHVLEEEQRAAKLALAKVSLQAARNQAATTAAEPGEGTIESMDAAEASFRAAKYAIYCSADSPLSFEKRLGLLREMLQDDLLSVYERLYAARIGLAAAGVVQMPPPPAPAGNTNDFLRFLVSWMRNAIREHEYRQRAQSTHVVSVRLGPLFHGGADAFRDFVTSGGAVRFDFKLTDAELKSKGTFRILDLGLSVALMNNAQDFQDMLETADDRSRFSMIDSWHTRISSQFSFPASLTLPQQSASFADGSSWTWSKNPMQLPSEVGIWTGAPPRFLSGQSQYRNANPLGTWTLEFDGTFFSADSAGELRSLKKGVNNTLFDISDVILTLRVAVLPEKRA